MIDFEQIKWINAYESPISIALDGVAECKRLEKIGRTCYASTDKITNETKIKIKKTKLYKSYKFSFHGWSHFKLAVCDLGTTGKDGAPEVFSNRQGKDFIKLIKKNLKNPQ